jgi:hypothetical protein
MADPTGTAPKPPQIPDTAPQALKDFIDCRADSYAFADGPLEFLEMQPKPKVAFTPGSTPDTATLAITVMGFTLKLPAAIRAGQLSIDTSGQWLMPGKVATDVKRFTDDLNGWFASNGKQLSSPAFGPDGMTLTKVPLAGA